MRVSAELTPGLLASYDQQAKHPHENKDVLIYTVSSILLFASTTAIILRLYIGRLRWKSVGWADASSILAWLCSTTFLILTIANVPTTRHLVILLGPGILRTLRTIYASDLIYFLGCALYRAAALHFFLRTFTQKHAIYSLRVLLAASWLSAITFIMVKLLQCTPFNHSWRLLVSSKCINIPVFLVAAAVINTILDSLVFAPPLLSMYRSRTVPREKRSILIIFIMGIVVIISSIMRAYYSKSVFTGPESYDPIWNHIPAHLWSITELCVGLICGCLLPILPFSLEDRNACSRYSIGWASTKSGRSDRSDLISCDRDQTPTPSFGLEQLEIPAAQRQTSKTLWARRMLAKPARMKEKFVISQTLTTTVESRPRQYVSLA